jgi:uncharacterized membrane protein HdeD (DUF308 family)
LSKTGTETIRLLFNKFHQQSTWQAFRGPLLVLLLGIAAFLFFTQEAMFQKIIALVAGLSSVITLIPKIFGSATSGKMADAKEK